MDVNQQVKNGAAARSHKRWLVVVGYAVVVLALLLGFRYWREWQANEPVYEDLAAYLSTHAEQSLKAQEYLQRYYRVRQRETVAARDFPVVCGNVTLLAESDGVQIGPAWATMAKECRKAVGPQTLGLLP